MSADAAPTGATSGAVDIHVTQQPDAHLYDAELRALDGARLHVRWGGRHAAATLAVLQREHRIDDGPVRQIEWGAYEVVLVGADMRRLLDWVMPGGCAREPATLVAADGPAGRWLQAARDVQLGHVLAALDDDVTYSLVTDVF